MQHWLAVYPTEFEIPMTGKGTIFDLRRSFPDGDGIDNPALGVPVNAGVPRAADPPLRSQMPNQPLFQLLTARGFPSRTFVRSHGPPTTQNSGTRAQGPHKRLLGHKLLSPCGFFRIYCGACR